MSTPEDRLTPAPSPQETTQLPPNNEVLLPLGLFNPVEGVMDTAHIRELNGYDEEVFAASKTLGAALIKMLSRAVTDIGGLEVTPQIVEELSLGDRMELLLGIRVATWGEYVDIQYVCSACNETVDESLSVYSDIPRKLVADKVKDRQFTLDLKAGTGLFQYPNGAFHDKVLTGKFNNSAELATELIHNTLLTLNENPITSLDTVRKMTTRDRLKIVERFSEFSPGPDIDRVPVTCPNCSTETKVAVAVGALFPL